MRTQTSLTLMNSLGNEFSFFPRYSIYGDSGTIVSPTGIAPGCVKIWLTPRLNDEDKFIFFDTYVHDILTELQANAKPYYFSISPMIIPSQFKLICNLNRNDIDASIASAAPLDPDTLFIEVMHNISPEKKGIGMPCSLKPSLRGGKMCAFKVLTSKREDDELTLDDFLFYVELSENDEAQKEILRKLNSELYFYYPMEAAQFSNFFMIPIQFPDRSIGYYAIPDNVKGREKLTEWLNSMKENVFIAINRALDPFDDWGVFITMEAFIVY